MAVSTALLIEDHPLVADAMRNVIEILFPHITVVTAHSAEVGIQKAKAFRNLDFILTDYGLPGMSGNEAAKLFCQLYPETKVIVYSGNEDYLIAQGAIRAGAVAFFSKAVNTSVMGDVIRQAVSGALRQKIWLGTNQIRASDRVEFTARQLEVLTMLVKGLGNKEIANQLGLAEITVKIHVSAIMRTLGVVNRTQAVMKVRELGMNFDRKIAA